MLKKILVAAVAMAAVALLPYATNAQGLCVGEPAPKLDVKTFVKGTPVTKFEKGKIYVVEFWATWCGPCRDAIPHLTEMAKKNKEVTFVGVSVWEGDQKLVTPFIEKMGDKMDYHIAMDFVPAGADGFKGAMALTWLQEAEQRGIPTSFIIDKEGKVAWIGHPMIMDEPLAKIVAGKWDMQTEAAKSRKTMFAAHKLRVLMEQINPAMAAQDYTQAAAIMDGAITSDPEIEADLARTKARMLHAQGKQEEEAAYINRLIDSAIHVAPSDLNFIAWDPIDPDAKQKAPPALIAACLKAALHADELMQSKDAMIADTLAAAYFADGKVEKAVQIQERAIQMAKGTLYESDIPDLTRHLTQYKAGK